MKLRIAVWGGLVVLLLLIAWFLLWGRGWLVDRHALVGKHIGEVRGRIGPPFETAKLSIADSKYANRTPEEENAWRARTVYIIERYYDFEVVYNVDMYVIEVRDR